MAAGRQEFVGHGTITSLQKGSGLAFLGLKPEPDRHRGHLVTQLRSWITAKAGLDIIDFRLFFTNFLIYARHDATETHMSTSHCYVTLAGSPMNHDRSIFVIESVLFTASTLA